MIFNIKRLPSIALFVVLIIFTNQQIDAQSSAQFSTQPKQANTNTNFLLPITASNVNQIGAYDITLTFNPSIIEVLDATQGSLVNSTGNTAAFQKAINNTQGTIVLSEFSFGSNPGASGNGTLATLSIKAKSGGNANLTFSQATYTSKATGDVTQVSKSAGIITVVGTDIEPTPTITQTPPTPTVTITPSPTEIPGNAGVNITFRLQGVTASPPSGIALIPTEVTVRLFRGSESAPLATRKITPQINSLGIHMVTINDFPSGNNYRLCIKGQSHLQKCFNGVNLSNNQTSELSKADEYSDQLWAGDLNNDNVVDAADIAIVTSARQRAIFSQDSYKVPLSLLKQKMEQLNVGGAIIISPYAMNADIDKNGFVTEADKALAQIKYTTLRFPGDQ